MNKTFKACGLLAVLYVVTAGNSGCNDTDSQIADKQEATVKVGIQAVGLPAIANWTELKNMKKVYEICDQAALITYTYNEDLNGHLHFRFKSIGYPFPFGTQFSNPEKRLDGYTLPQAEPNGLFKPSTAEASWIMAVNPRDSSICAVYAEPRLWTFPWELTQEEMNR